MSKGYIPLHNHASSGHVYPHSFHGKRQVWIKLRPTSKYQDSVLSINRDGKTLELSSPLDEKRKALSFKSHQKSSSSPRPILHSFVADGILENCSHEDTFVEIAKDVIEKAMNGTSGVILSLGPQDSGKSFTIYGDLTKYENRGILPRSFEKIFEYAEGRSHEYKYSIHMGMIDIRKDKIRDLISLRPDDNGPNGILLHPINCAEHGLMLLLRALAGQKLLSRYEEFGKYHTIVYIDINGEDITQDQEHLGNDSQLKFYSRITFARVATIPLRRSEREFVSTPIPRSTPNEKIIRSDDCFYITPATLPLSRRPSTAWNAGVSKAALDDGGSARGESESCCSRKSGIFGETISIRRDLLFLEEMFIRVSELQKLNRYYHKLLFLGMEGIMRKPNLAPSQYFRQSKLCNCLQDILCSRNETRILLHLRPEFQFLPTVLTVLRFAERLRSIPSDLKADEFRLTGVKMTDLKSLRKEIKTLRNELNRLSKSARELGDDTVQLTPSHMNILQTQAAEYIDGKIEKLEVESKAEAQALFENFRTLYQTASHENKDVQEDDGYEERGSSSKDLKSRRNQGLKNGNRKDPDEKKQDQRRRDKEKSQRKNKSKKKLKSKASQAKHEESKDQIVQVKTEVKVEEVTGTEIVEEEEEEEAELPTVSNEEIDEESLKIVEEFPYKIEFASRDEALVEFGKTEMGKKLFQNLGMHEAELEKMTVEHGGVLRVASDLVKEISSKQAEFDSLQQERHVKGEEYDISGNIVVPKREKDLIIELRAIKDSRDQMFERAKHLKLQLYKLKKELDEGKVNYEKHFQNFCLEQYSAIYEESHAESEEVVGEEFLPHPHPYEDQEFFNLFGIETFGKGFGENISKNFDEMKRIAQEQARAILKYYRSKPKWRKY